MAKRRRSSTHRVPPARSTFQFKISLKYIRPAIWRRVVVPDNRTLGDLHWIIQLSMGWTNSHLHLFRIGLLEYGAAGDDEEVGFSAVDENSALLSCLGLGKGSKFIYEYDFGDSWTHEIVVEKIEPATQVRPPVRCLSGARACPPEDCGGVPGYYQARKVLKKARTEDDRQLKEWLGDYDPEEFDLWSINSSLGN